MECPVIGLMGLPGAGKTTIAKSLENRVDYNFYLIKMKDIASEEYYKVYEQGLDVFPDDMKYEIQDRAIQDKLIPNGDIGKEIAEWVDSILDINNNYFATKAVEKASNIEDIDYLVVDGIRSVSDVEEFEAHTDEFHLIYINTPFNIRLERIMNRNREGEEDIDVSYLIERDETELSWGVDEILKERNVPVFYNNYESTSKSQVEFDFFLERFLS